MLKGLGRLGRALWLVLRPVRYIGPIGRTVLAILTLIAASSVALWKEAFFAWVKADWTHLAFLVGGVLAVFALLAVVSHLKNLARYRAQTF